MSDTAPDVREAQGERKGGPSFAAILTGLALLAIGVIWLLETTDVLSVSWYVVFAVVLMAIGLALVIGSTSGEHGGLITVGVILTILLTVATWTDTRFEGGAGDREYAPASIEDLNDSYRLAAGTMTLDLRQIDFPAGETDLEVRVGAGELIVLVPEDLAVSVDWRIIAGDATVFDREQSGMVLDDSVATDGYQQAEERLYLDLIVTLGTIEVRQ